MNATHARDQVCALAKTDFPAALALARQIEDPWFRAQALAWVGRYAPAADFRAVLDEARAVSFSAQSGYAAVASAAWWVRAWVERAAPTRAAVEVQRLVARSAEISNPVGRLDALFLLFQAVFELEAARALVLEALVAACSVANSWKAGDRLREAALMLAPEQPDLAQRVIAAMPEGRFRRQAVARSAAGQSSVRRSFFW